MSIAHIVTMYYDVMRIATWPLVLISLVLSWNACQAKFSEVTLSKLLKSIGNVFFALPLLAHGASDLSCKHNLDLFWIGCLATGCLILDASIFVSAIDTSKNWAKTTLSLGVLVILTVTGGFLVQ